MERKIKKINLINYDIELIAEMNWGEKEQLQSELIKGARINEKGLQEFDTTVILNAKYKTCEILIHKIIDKDGKEIEYTKDWLNNLSIEDGDKLMLEIDALTSISKKKD